MTSSARETGVSQRKAKEVKAVPISAGGAREAENADNADNADNAENAERAESAGNATAQQCRIAAKR
jgi:hypothetical protein